MTDIPALEREILAAIASAADEAALEAVRVAALGKKGSVSELLKTLGGMSPDERKVNGPLFNALARPRERSHRRAQEPRSAMQR